MASDAEAKKRRAALAALELAAGSEVLGVGTGSTVNLFIEALAASPGRVQRAVSSSEASSARLRAAGIAVVDLNELTHLSLYLPPPAQPTPPPHLIQSPAPPLS